MPSRTRRTLFSLVFFFALRPDRHGDQPEGGRPVQHRRVRPSATICEVFTSVYDLVAQNYAEPLTGDKADKAIYDGAIPGMLRTLDPHSSFYDPKAYAKMREDQHGKYYGVGMLIQPQCRPPKDRRSHSL